MTRHAAHTGAVMRRAVRWAAPLLLAVLSFINPFPINLSPLAGPGQAQAQAREAVPVRTGKHDGFVRVVFDWDKPVGYRIDRSGQTVRLRFGRMAKIDVSSLGQALPNHISAAAARREGGELEVSLYLAARTELKHYRAGAKLVLDLTRAPRATSRRAVESPSSRAATVAPPRPKAKPAATPEPTLQPTTQPTTTQPRPGKSAAAAAPRDDPPPRRRAKRESRSARISGPLVSIDVKSKGGRFEIYFNWRREAAAAVFRRDDTVWVVFDRPARLALAPIFAYGGRIITQAEQIPVNGASALRLDLKPAFGADVRRAGTVWVVGLTRRPRIDETNALKVVAEPLAPGGGRVIVPVKQPGALIRLNDPAIGDQIDVIPLLTPGAGIGAEHRFLAFDLLPSIQGVAARRNADQVFIRPLSKGVVISRQGGLALSAKLDRARRSRPFETAKLFDLSPWTNEPEQDIRAARQRLLHIVATADRSGKLFAHMDIARFYVAHGLGVEALGALRSIEKLSQRAATEPGYRALLGAARYISGQYAGAARAFGHRAVRDHPVVQPFRAAIAAARGDWAGADKLFLDLEAVLAHYPRALRQRFMLLATEASLAMGDGGRAGERLAWFDSETGMRPGQRAWLAVLKGYDLRARGDFKGAYKVWDAASGSRDRLARAKANLAILKTRWEQKEISHAEALKGLNALSFAWRGDVFEFDLLRQIAKIHVAQKDFRAALTTLERVISYFPGVDGARSAKDEMRDIYRQLFQTGAAKDLSPVRAIALYEEYRELAPKGPEGVVMARRLVDRLVEVNLLDESARLLDRLIASEGDRKIKAKWSLRLAGLQLNEENPAAALKTLDRIGIQGLDSGIVDRRRYLRVKALYLLARHGDALRLLENDNSPAARTLRADIHWHAADWQTAAIALADLVSPFDGSGQSMGEKGKFNRREARNVLRWALAVNLSGDRATLARLRADYGDAMARTPLAASFVAVTDIDSTGHADIVSLAEAVADTSSFDSLLSSAAPATRRAPQRAVN